MTRSIIGGHGVLKQPTPDIAEFPPQSNGTRIRNFAVRGIEVSVRAGSPDKDVEARALADTLAAHAAGEDFRWTMLERQAREAVERAEKMEQRALAAEARLPPPSPERLLGVGCVRFDSTGRLWLLNQRKHGWASFAVRVDGWDDLFRRFAARVTSHGTDESGAWWEVQS